MIGASYPVLTRNQLAPEDRSAGGSSRSDPAFASHLHLVERFLAHRLGIVERIEALLNAQRKPIDYLQNGPLLSRHVEECFFASPVATREQSRLRGHLEETHSARGFRPREIAGLHNGLVDPGEMMVRAFHLWGRTRWPGRNGRVRYAQTLFNLYLIRCLTLLSLRVWDEGAEGAGNRLAGIQGVLEALWKTTPGDQPVLVRDARWLIPLAQSPATDELGPYFEVAARIAELPDRDRIRIHDAGVRMTGGHLRSQIRYFSLKRGVPLDELSLVLSARNTNALDYALLIQDLVPLLAAYERAWQGGDERTRIELAGAICQGVSPDPELFLNRLELLGPYSMIEDLFVATDPDGRARYTPVGRRHVELLEEYGTRLARVSKPLADDCPRFRPIPGEYSPYGVLYGFSSDLLEHMAFRTLLPDVVTEFGLEDVFADGDAGGRKLVWVNGWRKLPHLPLDVQKLYEYPHQFAEDIFGRVERELRRRASGAGAGVRTGRLFVASGIPLRVESSGSSIPDLPIRFIESSDAQMVAAGRAVSRDEVHILGDRREGRSLLSCRTPGGWAAISKGVLTEVLAAGQDVRVAGLVPAAADALALMCPALVHLEAAAPSDT